MSFLNKIFKNKITGDTFKIIDVYQNVAITSNKDKIDTKLLENNKIFVPVESQSINESFSMKKDDEVIDPNKFFSSSHNFLAESLKSIDTSKIKDEPVVGETKIDYPGLNTPISNESAVIYSDPEDEIEELKRKYGATSVDDSLRKQNEVFSRLLEDEDDNDLNTKSENIVEQFKPTPQIIENKIQTVSNPPQEIQRFEVQDPVITMFKNVKRNVDFNISLKIDGKIPRLDFIEMMEDSYEISIIEYLADEFTNNLIRNPEIIRDKIIDKIKSLIVSKNNIQTNNSAEKEVGKLLDTKKTTRTTKPRVKSTKNTKE